MPRHSDTFQCQVGIQSGAKCLRFNSLVGSNEDQITEEITVSISYCVNDSWLTVYDIIHAGTEVYVLLCFIWLYPGSLESTVLSLISFIFALSSFYPPLYLLLLLGDKETRSLSPSNNEARFRPVKLDIFSLSLFL